MGQTLAATADTLRILKLDLHGMGLVDATFADFCSVGLAPLIQLRRLSLNVSHNDLTNVGVAALQHALRPTVRDLDWTLAFNKNVRFDDVDLREAHGLRSVTLDVSHTPVTHLQMPVHVTSFRVDLQWTMRSPTTADAVHPHAMFVSGIGAVRQLRLHLDCNTVSILRHIPVARGVALDLKVDTFDMSVAAVEDMQMSIRTYNSIGMLKRLDVYQDHHVAVESLSLLPSVLAFSWNLVSLLLEMPSATGVAPMLFNAAHYLVQLVEFGLTVRSSSSTFDVCAFALCARFADPNRALRLLSLDVFDIDLTDEAVAFLVDVGVDRYMKNRRNITTLRVEGSSVGPETLKALATSVACPGFKFVSTFDVSPGCRIVPTRMTAALLRQQWLHNPFVPPTAIQWDAA